MDKIKTVSQAKSQLRPVFDSYGVKKAVLFGSVAKGTATENSDLDLLVDSGLRGLNFMGFVEAIREAAGVPVDVFDITHIDRNSRIEHEINRTGVTIYEK